MGVLDMQIPMVSSHSRTLVIFRLIKLNTIILAYHVMFTDLATINHGMFISGPMIYKGIYHLFYQYNPYAAVPGNITWAHSTSTDLINWTPQDIAIAPSQPFDSHGCWSGSATILPGGRPAIFYTGIIDSKNTQVQNLAVPKIYSDPYLREWFKYPKNPLIASTKPIDPTSFRDPTTAWLGPDKRWRMLIGSIIDNKGLAILYRSSKDFKHWTMANHPLHSENNTGMWECPDFYPVSIVGQKGVGTSIFGPKVKHVLKASLPLGDCYTIGTYSIGEDKFIPDMEESLGGVLGLRYDYGKFYASKTFFDSDKNRRILWGWVSESSSEDDNIKKGWSGLQAIPRSLWLDKSGKQLVQWPVVELESLRINRVQLPSKFLEAGSVLEVSDVTAAQADIEISFEITEFEKAEVLEPNSTNPQLLCSQKGASVKSAFGPFGLLVLASKDLQEYTAVFFRIFKGQEHKYVVLMCSDQSRSSLNDKNDKTSYGAFLIKVRPEMENNADIEISFEITEFEKAEVLEPNSTNPQLLCSQKGASVKSAFGPFGLLVLASKDLQEYTAVFFRIFKGQEHKYVVLMCSDQSRSSLNDENDKTSYGAFLNVDPVHEKLSLRSLIDHSIVESFGGGGKACITARVYPTLAIENDAHLYAFNYGTEKVKITSLSAWSMKKAQIN
ncbi:hypothetical protein LWI29_008863 [Acer saccharum]|uniref:Beta-fructofuranosidase n=1 Tax=Acer saccharum TaxID=4024 RepID=A0AA39SD68_ACESA|nr:hypothetical protein LWI29_008863 [Acer saccharum]